MKNFKEIVDVNSFESDLDKLATKHNLKIVLYRYETEYYEKKGHFFIIEFKEEDKDEKSKLG